MSTILIKPVISEKSFREAANSKYTFVVKKSASKMQIKDAVEATLKVDVVSINTFNLKGKIKKTKGIQGLRSDTKRAVITTNKKAKIDLFEIEKKESNKLDKKKTGKTESKKNKEEKDNKDVSVKIKKSK